MTGVSHLSFELKARNLFFLCKPKCKISRSALEMTRAFAGGILRLKEFLPVVIADHFSVATRAYDQSRTLEMSGTPSGFSLRAEAANSIAWRITASSTIMLSGM